MSKDDKFDKLTEVKLTDYTEGIKLGFEAMKQLTTLNAGSIVVIGTFLSNIFPTDKQGTLTVPWYIKFFIGAAFVGFGVSLISSTLTMLRFRSNLENLISLARQGMTPPAAVTYWRKPLNVPLSSFNGGLICFGTAVLLNLFFGS
jgi:hypothetical protein